MSIAVPSIVSRARHGVGESQGAYAAKVEGALGQIEQTLRRLAAQISRLEKVRAAPTAAASPTTGPDPWFEITSAVTITLDPANSSRQYLDLNHNTTISLDGAYTGDGQTVLIIRQGATPRLVNWGPEWGHPYEAQVAQTPQTYTVYRWEFIEGYPYLTSFLTDIPLPPV